jgi:hypothetical protein
MDGKRVNQALTRNLRPGCLSILAAALILTTCTSGRFVPDNDSQSLPLFAWQRGHTMLIGLVRRIGVDRFDLGTDEAYQSRTAKQDGFVPQPTCKVTRLSGLIAKIGTDTGIGRKN